MVTAVAGTSFVAAIHDANPGRVGSVTLEVYDPEAGTVAHAASASGITEPRPGTYAATLSIPNPGTWVLHWMDTGDILAEEDLLVLEAGYTGALIPDLEPSIGNLASIMNARTEGQLSNQGVFNSQTRPTDVEAEKMLDIATSIVVPKFEGDVSDASAQRANLAILFKAAMLIETSYKSGDEDSGYEFYKEQYEELLPGVTDRAAGKVTSIGLSDPRYAI